MSPLPRNPSVLSRIPRRRFLRASAAAGAALLASPALLRGKGLNEKLNIAIVGAGGRGASNTQSVSSENIVALCDVDEDRLAKAAQNYPRARKYTEFRKLCHPTGD